MDTHHALIIDCKGKPAVGNGDRDTAKAMSAQLPGAVTARKDDATATVQAATTNVAGWGPPSGGGGLLQTPSG